MTDYDTKSFFLPQPAFHKGLIAIVVSATVIACCHLGLFYILKQYKRYQYSKLISSGTDNLRNHSVVSQESPLQNDDKRCMKTSYQLTNLLVNLFFGLYGSYICLIKHRSDGFLFSSLLDTRNVLDHIRGYEQFYIFGSLQVGYNLWSLPVGIIYIHEPLPMIAHHVAVIIICTLTATSHYGFRLHAPFLLGIYEISSVPLSVMNYLKDHREWSEKYAKMTMECARVSFAILFLSVRMLLGTPHSVNCIRGAYAVMTNDEIDMHWIWKGWIGLVWLSEVVLQCLQIYWSWLIVKGVANRVLPRRRRGVDVGVMVKNKKE